MDDISVPGGADACGGSRKRQARGYKRAMRVTLSVSDRRQARGPVPGEPPPRNAPDGAAADAQLLTSSRPSLALERARPPAPPLAVSTG